MLLHGCWSISARPSIASRRVPSIWVAPSGSKLWNIAYRYGGKQLKLSLGAYPAVGLIRALIERGAS